jgi:hypothetical protein
MHSRHEHGRLDGPLLGAAVQDLDALEVGARVGLCGIKEHETHLEGRVVHDHALYAHQHDISAPHCELEICSRPRYFTVKVIIVRRVEFADGEHCSAARAYVRHVHPHLRVLPGGP